VPCRVGTLQLHRLLEKLTAGQGTQADLDKLESLCETVARGSLCGLGQNAPNPIVSTLQYFRHEYDDLVQAGALEGAAD
jgi:bidirectional [NiFe] hydrogenase diaphorase subunit